MNVDPNELRSLAASMYEAGSAIDEIDVRGLIDGAGDFMPGCDVPAATRQAGEYTEGAYLRVAQRARRIAAICRGNASDFEITDEDYRAKMAAVGGRV